MASINPYLNFAGNTEEAFNFYKAVFGSEFTALQRFSEIPGGDTMAPADQEKIMHVALPIGKGTVLMATDALESMGHTLTPGNSFSIAIAADSEAEADRLFQELSAGGKVTTPLAKAFWGDYFGSLTDKFGVQWMVDYSYDHQPA